MSEHWWGMLVEVEGVVVVEEVYIVAVQRKGNGCLLTCAR